ncbi:hypothetical protein [Brevibacillus migulae]|uniref:hypothetical protein n=1 Tax=Brevibacillus migulae TaxID=1644114 RepID=UPI00106DFEC0|nr:hypothetical protein [Brevibacillus migulae]
MNRQLDNIVQAVAQGLTQSAFLEKMIELDGEKNTLEFSIKVSVKHSQPIKRISTMRQSSSEKV